MKAIPKTRSAIDKALKNFELKNKEQLDYWIRLNLASIKLDVDALRGCEESHFKELIRRYEILEQKWTARLEMLKEMSEEVVNQILNK